MRNAGVDSTPNESAVPFVRLARVLLIIVFAAFALFLFGGLALTDMGSQFMEQLPTLGMIVVLADLYAGSFIIMLWAFYREKHWWIALTWSLGFILLGNLGTLFYVLWALRGVTADRHLNRFFHGHRAPAFSASQASF